MKWHYKKQRGKSEYGPVSLFDLKVLISEGKLKAKDFVRAENDAWWETIQNCKKLQPILESKDQLAERFNHSASSNANYLDTFIGIDFGTTKTMVAEYQQKKRSAKVHKLGRDLEIPTLIHVSEAGETVFGDLADEEGDHDPLGRIQRFKLDLGKQGKRPFGRTTCTAVDLTADFLCHLRKLLNEEVIHQLIDQVVLTVPAIFGPAQRKDLTKAAKLAGFKKVELLAEPVAAGIAYCDHEGLNGKLRFLVVDWGGGTFDVALLERNENGVITVPKEFIKGRQGIGGEDLDDDFWESTSRRLVKDGKTPLEARPNTSWGKYRRDLKRTKERLSYKIEVALPILSQDNKPESLTWKRCELEDVLSKRVRDGVSAVAELVDQCRKADMNPEFILLAGGTSRIPLIHKLLAEACSVSCRSWTEGRDAIAIGAALHAHSLWGEVLDQTEESREVASADVIVHDHCRDPAILCPHCESSVEGVSAPGNWQCTECGGEFGVTCACPRCGLEVEVEEWGNYSCPSKACRCEFNATDCIMVSLHAVLIECPHCAVEVDDVTGTGEWSCSSCGGSFVVACACPECGLEVEVEEWGNYSCPSKACRCEFNAADYIMVSLHAVLIECPHCAVVVDDVTGAGEWSCSSCGGSFVVACACPECGLEVEVKEWGIYSCPSIACRCEFNAEDCVTVSLPAILIECPHCAVNVGDVTSTGDWTCPSCGGGFTVGCECPECGLDIEVEEWGSYRCPSKACRCEFNTSDCVTVHSENEEVAEAPLLCPKCRKPLGKGATRCWNKNCENVLQDATKRTSNHSSTNKSSGTFWKIAAGAAAAIGAVILGG